MFFRQNIQTQNQQIHLPILKKKELELWIKREDEIHPFVSGNKFRKLKYNLQEAKHQQKDVLLTFGGAYSNHIVATTVAGKMEGFQTIGVIRGEELGNDIEKTLEQNATLREAHKNGMQFVFVSREAYRKKTTKDFINRLQLQFGDFYLIPEGGTNDLAIKGCEEILTEEDRKFDYICVAVGTGGTISGLINTSHNHQKVLGFPALKGDFLLDEIAKLTTKQQDWALQTAYHFGGYGKYNQELIEFINLFKEQTNVLLDPIYTGKMMFGVFDMIRTNQFDRGSKIVVVHTGGLQGIEGVNQQLKNKQLVLINVE